MPENKTIITTGKGEEKSVVAGGGPQVSSRGTVKKPGASHQVDIVFVFDTTGSMSDKITGLLHTCNQFVDEAKTFDLDPQFGLISFGDISIQGGGDRIDIVVPLTRDIQRIHTGLSQIPRNSGFGNWGESSLEALEETLKLSYRKEAVKVLILITDEPALQHHITAASMIAQLKKREFLMFVVATADQYYQDMAKQTGGVWKQISATTDLNEILKLFRELAKKVSQIAKDVHQMGGGSVSKYLALKAPEYLVTPPPKKD